MINKETFIAKYAEMHDVPKSQAKIIVNNMIDTMQSAVIEDGGVDFYGFMKIEKVHKEAGTARSPQTGETIAIPEKDVPKAKFSTRFKKAVNGEA